MKEIPYKKLVNSNIDMYHKTFYLTTDYIFKSNEWSVRLYGHYEYNNIDGGTDWTKSKLTFVNLDDIEPNDPIEYIDVLFHHFKSGKAHIYEISEDERTILKIK
tara:strand:- start:8768 stop:9079 length:312 start_codon:yes stop_codon:yes gene_type:complete